jgi:hypothetical protein
MARRGRLQVEFQPTESIPGRHTVCPHHSGASGASAYRAAEGLAPRCPGNGSRCEIVGQADKPLRDTVLQSMARAYPDPVDLALLSMVTGSEPATLQAETDGFIRAGLAQPAAPRAAASPSPPAACITDRGMAVACGLVADATKATTLLERLEARTLRALLCARIRASRLPTAQIDELRQVIAKVPDGALMDAARIWAHQPVSDWRPLAWALVLESREVHTPSTPADRVDTQTV